MENKSKVCNEAYIKWPYLEEYFRYCHKIFTQAFLIYYNTKYAKNSKSDFPSSGPLFMSRGHKYGNHGRITQDATYSWRKPESLIVC
jgi:hypothetical protein